MSRDWLEEDLWRAHVSWLTPTWVGATETGRGHFDAREWVHKLRQARYGSLIFYVKHHDGFCAYPSRYAVRRPERDYVGECVTEARKYDMRFMTYFSSVLDQLTAASHSDWQVAGRDGEPATGWFSRLWPRSYCCINNPGYRALLLGQLDELMRWYRPDGVWLDVFSPNTEENCFCRHCQERYARETGEELFESTGDDWYRECFADLAQEIRKLVTASNEDCVLTYNAGSRIPGVDSAMDLLTHEAVDASTVSLMCRGLRSTHKPFETTYRLYTAVGSWAMKAADRVLLETMASAAHGGACSIEVPPTPTGKLMDEPVSRLRDVGGYIRRTGEYLVHTEPQYDAAVFQRDAAYGCPREVGWWTVLTERDIPFACIYPDADLSLYQLLVLDDARVLDKALAKRLRSYVAEGGSLIVECEAAAWENPAGEILSGVLGVVGSGMTGRATHYVSGLQGALAADMGEDELVVEGDAYRLVRVEADILAYLRYEFAERADDRNIILNLPPAASPSEEAAVTLHGYGRGRAMYLTFPLAAGEIRAHRDRRDDSREYPMQLASNLARFMIPEPLLRGDTPSGVEVVVNRQGPRHIVHLLNHYVGGRHADNRSGVLSLADVPVTVNEKRVGHVRRAFHIPWRAQDTREEELPVRRDGDWAEVTIPRLFAHDLVVLEH